jgi:hypothetical protein
MLLVVKKLHCVNYTWTSFLLKDNKISNEILLWKIKSINTSIQNAFNDKKNQRLNICEHFLFPKTTSIQRGKLFDLNKVQRINNAWQAYFLNEKTRHVVLWILYTAEKKNKSFPFGEFSPKLDL